MQDVLPRPVILDYACEGPQRVFNSALGPCPVIIAVRRELTHASPERESIPDMDQDNFGEY